VEIKMKIEKSSSTSRSPVTDEGAKDVAIRWLISKEDGAENFAMRMFEIEPAGHTPLHTHPQEHEVFVLEGEGALIFEGKQHPLGAEYVVFVPPNKQHRFMNTGESVMRMLCIIPTAPA
jgi:quercetin dioxygenase-like cupin family protein